LRCAFADCGIGAVGRELCVHSGIFGAVEAEGALIDAGDFQGVDEEAGAFEMDLAGGDGLEEHGGGELDGLRVFERRKADLILARIGAFDVAELFFFRALQGILLPVRGHGLFDGGRPMGEA